jgi:hypothetical protein
MNLNQELTRLIVLLRIPIDSIVDLGEKLQLFLCKKLIGNIPYFIVNNEILYETNEKVLNWLNWIQIFNENRAEIVAEIQEQLEFKEEDEINVVILNFRRLQVEFLNNRGLFFYFNCEFIDGEWQVNIESND